MDRLETYLRRGSRRVRGWLDPFSAEVIAFLSSYQRAQGIVGATGEIGVHHGKLWLVLHLTTDPDERCFAVDVFDQQDKNTDGSGHGNLGIFRRNIEAHSGDARNVVIIACSSLELSIDALLGRCGQVRFFSVDGGHTAACTSNDLWLADRSLVDAGIVVLDDYFNPHWPDVSCGAARYFLAPESRLLPFAITPNKLFLARAGSHREYRAQLKAHSGAPPYFEKASEMFGAEVDVYGTSGAASSLARRLSHAARRLYWESALSRR